MSEQKLVKVHINSDFCNLSDYVEVDKGYDHDDLVSMIEESLNEAEVTIEEQAEPPEHVRCREAVGASVYQLFNHWAEDIEAANGEKVWLKYKTTAEAVEDFIRSMYADPDTVHLTPFERE